MLLEDREDDHANPSEIGDGQAHSKSVDLVVLSMMGWYMGMLKSIMNSEVV